MKINSELIAPCGINCATCMRYLATTRGLNKKLGIPQCTGCRPRNKNCKFIKGNCKTLKDKKISFCFECTQFPCAKLQTLDKRYTNRYRTSLIKNLLEIKEIGLDEWLEKEEKKWQCPSCGGTVSVHQKMLRLRISRDMRIQTKQMNPSQFTSETSKRVE